MSFHILVCNELINRVFPLFLIKIANFDPVLNLEHFGYVPLLDFRYHNHHFFTQNFVEIAQVGEKAPRKLHLLQVFGILGHRGPLVGLPQQFFVYHEVL